MEIFLWFYGANLSFNFKKGNEFVVFKNLLECLFQRDGVVTVKEIFVCLKLYLLCLL